MAFNILVVDDSAMVRKVLIRTLKLADIPLNEVMQAENGCQALELLAEHWIDLVLTDIHMPEMDGVEMIRQLAEDDVLVSLPVVVVSTEGSESVIEELRQKGVREFVRKPFTPESLKEIVETCLEVMYEK